MSDKFYVWKGPPTAVEVCKEGTKDGATEVIFSGAVAPDKAISVALPEDHPQVKSWLDFGLLEEKTETAETKPVKAESKKEPING